MGKAQRSAAVNFDDIPGKLPDSVVPDGADLAQIAHDAIEKLNDLQADSLVDNAIWRDLLSFTGTYRTIYSGATLLASLKKLSKQKHRSLFSLKSGKQPRIGRALPSTSWVDVDVSFSVEESGIVGLCEGTVSVAHLPGGQWRIWMLRTWLENFDGHGHPDVLDPAVATPHGVSNGTTNGGDTTVTEYDAVVIGGGQAGLSTAGRLKALGLRYMLLEKRPEIGDVWNTRYDSLRWHTSKHYGALPFGHTTYPEEDDYMLPAKRIGAGQKAWSEKYGINVQISTSVDAAHWDEATRTWTVDVTGPEGKQTFKCRDLVLTIGAGHLSPILPNWATPDKVAASGYKGTILHGTDYKSSQPWAGKRGIVVGTANTGHDVAEDMANCGMDTTIMQRGATFVFAAEWLHHAEDLNYNTQTHPAVADREAFTYPNKIMREIVNAATHTLIGRNSERFDALERAGFKLDRYGDIYNSLYIRFGGHYVDIGASARIAKGEIKVNGTPIKGMTESGLVLEDGTELPADLIVLCTGFDHNFRIDATRIVGAEIADQMDDFWGVDVEGEVRGHAKYAGHPNLYYHGGDVRMGRWFARFIALQIQANALGKPLERYLE